MAVTLYDIMKPVAIAGGLGFSLGLMDEEGGYAVFATVAGSVISGLGAAWLLAVAENRFIGFGPVANARSPEPNPKIESRVRSFFRVSLVVLAASAALGGVVGRVVAGAA